MSDNLPADTSDVAGIIDLLIPLGLAALAWRAVVNLRNRKEG
jgi:hypothetical protein